MAKIKKLKEAELIGGHSDDDIYPITSTQSIFSQNPDGSVPEGVKPKLEDRLQDDAKDREYLHRQSEKLVLSLTSDKKGAVEIIGGTIIANLQASAVTETFGDTPTVTLFPKDYTYEFSNASFSGEENNIVKAVATLPNTVGDFTSTFKVTYNGVEKSVDVTSNMNLRKYFGFATTEPTDITELNTSHFSNDVRCTITLSAISSGNKYKYIYMAVPDKMAITDVRQPDALNAPLAYSYIKKVNRVVGNRTYIYKLYRSNSTIDSTVSKRLTIS